MTKNQRDAIIAAVMVAACLAAAVRAFQHSKKNSNAAAPAAPAAVSDVETQLLEDARFIGAVRAAQTLSEEQGGRWNQEWERDPFRAEEVVSGGSIENLSLQGIFWEAEDSRAMINNKMLRIGDLVDGYKLTDIRRSSVVLWTGEKNLELSVFKSPFEQSAPEEDAAPASAAEPAAPAPEAAAPAKNTPLPDIAPFKKLNKNLLTVKDFVGGTEGAQNMAKMMGGGALTPAESSEPQESPKKTS